MLKEAYIKVRGHWIEEFEGLAALSPEYLEAHLASGAIIAKTDLISPAFSELIAIAIDVSTTHLYERGLRLHISKALRLGVTKEQIAAVILIVTGLGIQTLLVGLPMLVRVAKGTPADLSERIRRLSQTEEELKRKFISLTHVWSDAHQHWLLLSPDHFEAQLAVASAAFNTNVLTEKEKALILVAVNGAVSHLHEEGLRLSFETAFAAGASADEIIHVLRRVSPLGIHSVMLGIPILFEEAARLQDHAA